jgi:hypothetical protein
MEFDAEQEFRSADWKVVGLKLLAFVRYWARAHYGWSEGALMPTSKTPEDVTCDVYTAFSRGERKFAADAPMWVQLKNAAKSVLWNLHRLKEGKLTSTEEPEFFDPFLDGSPDPEEKMRGEEFSQRLFELLFADPKVKKNSDLRRLVEAIEAGAETVNEIVTESGLAVARVYELRRQLKPIAESVLNKMNREETTYEQKLSKSGSTAS